MWFSYKIKRLLVISIAIIILALAAHEGSEPPPKEAAPILYPTVPADLDPEALDHNIDSANIQPLAAPAKPASLAKAAVVKPEISAQAYLVANLDTGEVYIEHNPTVVFPIASLTKLITALVVLHTIPPDQKMTVNESMLAAYGNAGHLVLGETLTAKELLYPLLLESSNDAAEVLAQSYGYTEFIRLMNAFAGTIGMPSTFFKDASGMSSANSSNARDLFALSRHLYRSEKELLDLTRQVTMSVASTSEHGPHTWKTINPFPLDPHFIGGKTGRTAEARESMISLFRYNDGANSYPIAIIVLRADFTSREVDSSRLLEKFITRVRGG